MPRPQPARPSPIPLVGALLVCALLLACGGPQKGADQVPDRKGGQAFDLDGDGVPDAWTFSAKVAGRTVVRRKEFDLDFDGKVDVWRFFDAREEVQREQMDMDRDGKPDVTSVYAGGALVRKELDLEGDARPDVFKYYEGGVLVRLEGDGDGDGRVDYWEYYKDGRLTRTGSDEDGDGRPDPDKWIEETPPETTPTAPEESIPVDERVR